MKKKPFRLDADAERELEESVLWYERNRPEFGQELLDEVSAAIDRVRKAPMAFPPAPGVAQRHGARRALVKRFPYSIVFVDRKDEILVVAIAHAKRRPGYWLGRLGT